MNDSMKDPGPLPPDIAALLDAERRAPDPPAPVVDRMLDRVMHTVTAPTPLSTDPASAASAGVAHASKVGWVISHAVALTVGAGAGWVASTNQTPPPAQLVQPVMVPVVVPMPVQVEPVGEPTRPDPARSSPVRPIPAVKATVPAEDEALSRERLLVERAQAALGRGDHAGALEAVAQHMQAFPSGRLVEEREAIMVLALCKAGRTAEASLAAKDYLARYPKGLMRPAVQACLRGAR